MDRQQQRAERVIVSFKQLLGSELAGEITEEKYRDLALMVREVIAEAVGDAVEQVEAVTRRIRAESDRPERGM